MAPVIVSQDEPVLKDMRWGLIPFWAKDEQIGNRMINARAETVKEKPSFRNSLKRKRCLVLADFFYEWQKIPGSTHKQPMCIHLRDQEPFVFAGLWDTWKKPDDTKVESYTIITCDTEYLGGIDSRHGHMIDHQVPLPNLTFLVPRQLPEHAAQVLAQRRVKRFTPVFRDEYRSCQTLGASPA